MKILIINDYGVKIGGTEDYILGLKRGLIERGHDVKILTSDCHLNKKFFSDYQFYSIDQESKFRWIPYLLNFKLKKQITKIIQEFNPDLIHLNNFLYHTSPIVLFLIKGIPSVMTVHDYQLICPLGTFLPKQESLCLNKINKKCISCIGPVKFIIELLKRQLINQGIKNITRFITPSNYLKKQMELNGFGPVCTLYNGIKLFNYSSPPNHKILSYFGRLSPEKGVDYLIRAMPKIISKFPDAKLEIIGDGPEREHLMELSKTLGLMGSVFFRGKIPHEKISKYYQDSSIIIVPSIWPEPFGLIGPEAMSVGRPVIASNMGGIPEWLENGKTGFLVPPMNQDAIAKKVIYLLGKPKLMKQVGINGRKKAEKEFDVNEYVKKIERIYLEVIQKK